MSRRRILASFALALLVASLAWWTRTRPRATPSGVLGGASAAAEMPAAEARSPLRAELEAPPARADARTPPESAQVVTTEAPRPASLTVTLLVAGPRLDGPLELRIRPANDPGAVTAAVDAQLHPRRAVFDGRMEARIEDLPPRTALVGEVRRGKELLHTESVGEPLADGEARHLTWSVRRTLLHVDAREENGAPIADLELWLAPGPGNAERNYFGRLEQAQRTARTDARGRATFADLDPGSCRVGPAPMPADMTHPPDDAPCALAQRVHVRADAENVVELVVSRGSVLAGRVLGVDGAPHAEGIVLAFAEDAKLSTADVGAEGRFRFAPLLRGRYKLSVIETGDESSTSPVVEADAGDTDVVLRLGAGATLRGRVSGFDPAGADLPWITLYGDGVLVGHSLRCSEDGSFAFDHLTAAVYTVRALNQTQLARRTGIALRVGEQRAGVDLQLELAAKLVVRRAGRVPVRVRISHGIDAVDEVVLNDDEQTQLVFAGETAVEVLAAAGIASARQTFRLAPGETRRVSLSDAR